jgi:hypothetical protein
LRLANARIEAELEQIARIQRALLPDHCQKFPECRSPPATARLMSSAAISTTSPPLHKDGSSDGRSLGDSDRRCFGARPGGRRGHGDVHAILHTYPQQIPPGRAKCCGT